MSKTYVIIKMVAHIIVVATTMICTSCAKSDNNENILLDECPDIALEECTFETIGDMNSKTTVNLEDGGSFGSVNWQSGDNVTVFSVDKRSGINRKFLISDINGTSAKFSGKIECGTTSLMSIYPYSENISFNGTTYSNLVIPMSQTPTIGSFAQGVSLAYATGTIDSNGTFSNMIFENLCAVLCFTLPSNISFAKNITISANDNGIIAGAVTFDGTKLSAGSSNTSTEITLTGSFVGGASYCVAIIPRNYVGGFTFTIDKGGAQEYTRSNTSNINAEAGKIYKIGTLCLELSTSDFSYEVALSDNISSSTLNGTDAKFTMSMTTSKYSSLFTLKSYSVTFKDASGNTYRTLSPETSTMPSNVVMTPASGKPYIPKGTYSYEVTVTYNTGGSVDKTLKFSAKKLSRTASPSGFKLYANFTGYTSYSYYKGTDGKDTSTTNANNCDNATIYSVGASYASGLSSEVYSQCSSLLGISSTLDGSAKSGDQGSQSWSSHTIGATWSFDGASGTCANTRTVYITGLPYNKNNSNVTNFKSDWSFSGGTSAWDDTFFKLRSDAYANFKGFYIPASTNATISYKMKGYCSTRFVSCTTKLWVAGSTIVDDRITGTGKWATYESTAEVTFTSSNNTIKMQSVCSSSSWAVSQSQGFYFGVVYR